MLGRNGHSTAKGHGTSYSKRSTSILRLLLILPFVVALFAFVLYLSEQALGAPYSADIGLLKYVLFL